MRPLDPLVVEVLRDAYAKTGSLRLVARVYDLSPNTVRVYVRDMGVATQESIRALRTKDDFLIGLYVGLWMGDGTQYPDRGEFIVKICCNADCRKLNALVQYVFLRLFGKQSRIFEARPSRSAVVKCSSKFIFRFISQYTIIGSPSKTLTVRLRKPPHVHSRQFIRGCFLGLMLSDGSLKQQLRFNVTSVALAQDMMDILLILGFHPKKYVRPGQQNRQDLHLVWLTRPESRKASELLDELLKELGYVDRFTDLKEGKNEPGEI